jgi:hypothetical protein
MPFTSHDYFDLDFFAGFLIGSFGSDGSVTVGADCSAPTDFSFAIPTVMLPSGLRLNITISYAAV